MLFIKFYITTNDQDHQNVKHKELEHFHTVEI